MIYKSLKDCVLDLEKNGMLVRIPETVDPDLEMAEIHRRVYQAGGPAVFYEKVKGSPFPAVSNLFGSMERARFIFRGTLEPLKKIFRLKASPNLFFKNPFQFYKAPWTALCAWPKKVNKGPVLECQTSATKLPQIRAWAKDGGAFIYLPQVYTEDPDKPKIFNSNLGMYRIQMSGNDYLPNEEMGLHYQIRRDIGIHHTKALARQEPLRVSIFVGGPPAHTFAAVMYLPEGLPEVAFAGALGGRRFRYAEKNGFKISTEADFCITGFVDPMKTKPEGPFGDHLGYYSLKHLFPYLRIENIYHRKDAIWPFTVVGRPPQEDSVFGALVQEIAGPVIPKEIPGVKSVHAVDASGVHPLLLAIGSERYMPYGEKKPRELLTLANALLGYGPCSLAKYLMIAADEDNDALDTHNTQAFFRHMLERVNWNKDLHFQTQTTIDTLDYSGGKLNEGSKVVIAACGPKKRELASRLPENFSLPDCFEQPHFAAPGVLVLKSPAFVSYERAKEEMKVLTAYLEEKSNLLNVPLLVLADDSEFVAKKWDNFLWVTFTRSNPSHDIYGVGAHMHFKHWGCEGSLIVDARLKPHHAPPLENDEKISNRVESLAISGKCLHGII